MRRIYCGLGEFTAAPTSSLGIYGVGFSLPAGIAYSRLGGRGVVVADAIAGDAQNFDLFGRIATRSFPGGALLRWPGLVLGMTYYALRDRL